MCLEALTSFRVHLRPVAKGDIPSHHSHHALRCCMDTHSKNPMVASASIGFWCYTVPCARRVTSTATPQPHPLRGSAPCACSRNVETWLILPVVIRLSQRLSHACLSISTYTVKLRMAHYISYSLFDSPYYLDNRSNSRANTCANS